METKQPATSIHNDQNQALILTINLIKHQSIRSQGGAIPERVWQNRSQIIEKQRLADVAVQRELERQRQAKIAQEAAAARQLQAANAAADPDDLRNQRCYAQLYLGLYHEALGDAAKAKEHLVKAAGEFKMDHYMGRVAQVHVKLRGWVPFKE
mgnify:CR=1 FL=1